MSERYLGESIPKLGFGLMRLPHKDGAIDIEQTKQMVDHFLANGFTYFDTAYVYNQGGSEAAAKEALFARHPREAFKFADKLPIINVKEQGDMQAFVNTSLERSGCGYFDFYLLHALNKDKLAICDKFDAWGFMAELKAKGIAKHIGFSFHDTAEVLEEILSKHSDTMEFVQLQINYADWESPRTQSRLCFEICQKYNKPVIIMEPVKGGSLVTMSPEIQDIFHAADPNASVASWAVRYAASLPNLVTVLSGMSNMEQIADNTSFMKSFKPLSEGERATIGKVVEILDSIPSIPCTGCEYCVEGCPMKIYIPGIFNALNTNIIYGNLQGAKGSYAMNTRDGGKAYQCLQCGACEVQCPQSIKIIDTLKKAAEIFD